MALLMLALCVAGSIFYATSIVSAVREGRIDTVRLIGPGSVSYTGSGEPVRFGCALVAHALVMLGLGGASVALIGEVETADWMAAGGMALALIAALARRRLDGLRARALLDSAEPEEVVGRFPGSSATRIVRAAIGAAGAEVGGYRDRGGRGREAMGAALDQAFSLERRRRRLALAFAAAGAIAGSAGLVLGPRTELTGVYAATSAALALHTVVLERVRRRELERALPALGERLDRPANG